MHPAFPQAIAVVDELRRQAAGLRQYRIKAGRKLARQVDRHQDRRGKIARQVPGEEQQRLDAAR
jgi:hypothetical protein